MEIPFDWGGFFEGVGLVFNFFIKDVLLTPVGLGILGVIILLLIIQQRRKK